MRDIRYLAAFATILLFAGFYCFKIAFGKNRISSHQAAQPNTVKYAFILGGVLCILGGIYLLLKAVTLIQ